MTVIFYVCYHDLHASIFQMTDATRLMCLPSILMKTLFTAGPVIHKQMVFGAFPEDKLIDHCFDGFERHKSVINACQLFGLLV